MARIFIYIFSVLLLLPSALLYAQEGEKPAEKEKVYNGVYLGIDIAGPAMKLFGTRYLQTEASVDVNLLNRFFPVLEAGYGAIDSHNDNGLGYKTAAPFFRLGMNYNFKFKQKSESHFYAGVRYGFSAMSYDVSSTNLKDEIWGGALDFNRTGLAATANWVELVGGIRVQIYRRFLMGWSFRWKSRIKITEHEDSTPWYVPGYGYNNPSSFGFTYSLIYKF